MRNDKLMSIAVDELLKYPAGQKLAAALETIAAIQRNVFALRSSEDDASVKLQRIGTVLQLSLIGILAKGKKPSELTSEDFVNIAQKVSEYAILPDGQRYSVFVFTLYADYIDLSGVDDSNGLKFAPHYKIEEARNQIIDYEVSDLGIREDDVWKCKVSGRLTNTQEDEINLLYVNVVYYDANGNVLGISGTNITDVQPGDTVSFEITGQFFYDNVNYSDIAEYRVYPRAWYMQF